MRIVDVLYDDYAVVHTIKTKDGVSEVLNKLYSKCGSVTPQLLNWRIQDLVKVTHSLFAGRTSEASVILQQKFTQFSLGTGILPENIVILPQNGMSLICHKNNTLI